MIHRMVITAMKAILALLSGLAVVVTLSHGQESKYKWTNTSPFENAKLVERSPAEWEEISKRAIEELKLHGKKPEATPAPAAAPDRPLPAPRLQLVRVPQPAPLPQFKFDGVRLIKRELPQPINPPPGQQPVVRPHPTKPGVVLVPQWMIDYEPDFVREREAAEARSKAQQEQLEKQKREMEAMLVEQKVKWAEQEAMRAEQEAQRAAFAAKMEQTQQEAVSRRQNMASLAAGSHYTAPVYSEDWETEELREQAEENAWEIQRMQDEVRQIQNEARRMRDDLEWQLMQERQHRWMDCPSERGRHGTWHTWRGR